MTRTRMRDRHRSEWLICHLVCPPLIPYQQIHCRSHRNRRFRTRFFREPCPCPLRWTIRAPPLHPWHRLRFRPWCSAFSFLSLSISSTFSFSGKLSRPSSFRVLLPRQQLLHRRKGHARNLPQDFG